MRYRTEANWTRLLWFVVALASVLTASASGNGTSLIDAVKSGNTQTIRTLLKQHPDVNAQEADGMTALHWAVRNDDTETVQLLIRAGAKVKAANRWRHAYRIGSHKRKWSARRSTAQSRSRCEHRSSRR